MRHVRRALLVVCLTILASACASERALVAPARPAQYEVVGPASGSACGFLLFDLIPIVLNTRIDRAYRNAVLASGATMLTDVRVRERWYFAYAGVLLCTDVEGTAIRTR